MKFTIERRALVKMLELVGRKAPANQWRDKNVRLSACSARVFVEANESTGGVEALVLEDGTCFLNYRIFLKLLKMHSSKKVIIVEADERKITFVTTTLDVTQYSRTVTPPGDFRVFPVTDDWLSRGAPLEAEAQGVKILKLPNIENLIIEREKILDYLLNSEHRIGASKANFFTKYGFTAAKWQQLADALRIHGQKNLVKRINETGFGPRYEIEGKLDTPDGRSPHIRSVWQLDKGAVAPRLITAYPLEAR